MVSSASSSTLVHPSHSKYFVSLSRMRSYFSPAASRSESSPASNASRARAVKPRSDFLSGESATMVHSRLTPFALKRECRPVIRLMAAALFQHRKLPGPERSGGPQPFDEHALVE